MGASSISSRRFSSKLKSFRRLLFVRPSKSAMCFNNPAISNDFTARPERSATQRFLSRLRSTVSGLFPLPPGRFRQFQGVRSSSLRSRSSEICCPAFTPARPAREMRTMKAKPRRNEELTVKIRGRSRRPPWDLEAANCDLKLEGDPVAICDQFDPTPWLSKVANCDLNPWYSSAVN